jgi:2-methylisocitrate lyase-like PEP mutase family enzyme
MTTSTRQKRATFRALHADGCFVLPNPWDIGSARLLQHLGFAALASTSSGHAWANGRPDYAIERDEVLRHLTTLSAAVDLPINADYESGFAREPSDVAANVRLAIDTGVAGLSIEDRDIDGPGLYERALSVDRIRAARAAIDQSGEDVLLVARTEALWMEIGSASDAIDNLVAFADAGADCLYAPGIAKKVDIVALVKAVAPKPVNVLLASPVYDMAELAELGVRRISVGGALARVTWAAMLAAAEQLKAGSFAGLAAATPGPLLNKIFERY